MQIRMSQNDNFATCVILYITAKLLITFFSAISAVSALLVTTKTSSGVEHVMAIHPNGSSLKME